MNIHGIEYDSLLNGDGIRAVLWVSGCFWKCPGCQKPGTHDPASGRPFTCEDLSDLSKYLSKKYVSGITLSGGDPLYPDNRKEIGTIVHFLKKSFPNKTIWLYTGYLWEDISSLPFMEDIDVVVDGPFVKQYADKQYHWAGSTNQRVINAKASINAGKVILHECADFSNSFMK